MDRKRRRGLTPLVKFVEATSQLDPRDLLEIDGQRVHVRVSGEGPPLILLHGFMASFFTFREIVPVLAKRFRVITIDLNGFGLTERPTDAEAYRIENQADLVIRVMQEVGIESGIIIGHSYGAAVASVAGLRHPGRATGLILISPASRFDRLPWYVQNRPGQEVLYLLCRRLISDPQQYKKISSRAFFVDGILTDEVSETYRRHLLIDGLRSTFFGFMRVLCGNGFPRIAFEELTQPVLVLAGKQDAVIPLQQCHSIAELLQNGRVEIFDDCGHSALEERPAEVIESITRFAADQFFLRPE